MTPRELAASLHFAVRRDARNRLRDLSHATLAARGAEDAVRNAAQELKRRT